MVICKEPLLKSAAKAMNRPQGDSILADTVFKKKQTHINLYVFPKV